MKTSFFLSVWYINLPVPNVYSYLVGKPGMWCEHIPGFLMIGQVKYKYRHHLLLSNFVIIQA